MLFDAHCTSQYVASSLDGERIENEVSVVYTVERIENGVSVVYTIERIENGVSVVYTVGTE